MRTEVGRMAAALAMLVTPLAAQFGGTGADGSLRPTSNTWLDTTNRPDGWDFVDIHIPAGVTVELRGRYPAILRSLGPVVIDGILSADGHGASRGPGGWYNGSGPGAGRSGFRNYYGSYFPTPASHATSPPSSRPCYGSAIPFDLRGGSGGGDYTVSFGLGGWHIYSGGGGGGVVVLLADRGITIGRTGAVTANGGRGDQVATGGSGGSILLRALTAIDVQGRLSADSARHPLWPSGLGYVRMDVAIGAPRITGTVTGVTEALELPYLAVGDATLGAMWALEVTPRPGDTVATYLALNPASIPTPAGVLGLHPSEMMRIGFGTAATGGIEPTVPLPILIPDIPALRGITLYTQAIAFDQLWYSRLSNTEARTIQ